MANPTTLQMRQQEIHRPFQPLDTTEGRAGRPIAAPQAQYAGGWSVAARTTDNLGPLVGQYLRITGSSTKNDEDPELLTAQEYYAKATFDLENMIRTAPQDVRDAWRKEAAEHDQTTSEYLKGKADNEVQQILTQIGIPYRKQYSARENILDKLDIEGYKDIEKRDNSINKAIVEAAVKNGTADRNDDGTVNYIGTLEYNKKLIDANKKIINESKDPLQAIGLTVDNYIEAQPVERAIIDDKIFNDQKSAYNTYTTEALQKSIEYLLNGQMTPEQVRMNFDILYNDSERLIQEGGFPSEAIRTRLLNHLKTYKSQIDAVLSERNKTVDDMTKQLQGIQASIQTDMLLDQGEVGKLARTTAGFGATVTSQLIQSEIIKNLGKSAKENIATWDDAMKRKVAERFANANAIINGYSPRYGDHEQQRAAKVAVNTFAQQQLKANQDWNAMPFEEKNAIRNNYIDTYIQAMNALNGNPETMAYAMEYYANYIDVLNNPDTFRFLQVNPDITSQQYTPDLTAQVAARVIQSSSGPAGVWRTTVESPRRKIYYDAETDTFSSHNVYSIFDKKATGTGITSPITRDESWEDSITTLNKVYSALENATELALGRTMNVQEKTEVRDYIINLMKASGMPDTTFVMPETTGVKE